MKNMIIDNINIGKGIILAPMEGVTDLPFRILCKRMGADLVYTEFIASDAIVRNAEKSMKKMEFVDDEKPVAVQIFGANPDAMAESAKIIEASGADIVDINFGCWVKKVVNNNAGAAFLKEPQRMQQMVKTVVNSVKIPVTAKTRLGWDSNSINIVEVAQMLEDSGVKAIAVHCRTRSQGMGSQADWSWIAKVKAKINIPVILNGDVITPKDVKKAFDTTGCDGIMIGRAAIGNPFLFRHIDQYLSTGIEEVITAKERIDTCIEHLELNIKYKGDKRGLIEFRKHYSGYLKGLHSSSEIRQKLLQLEEFDIIKETLNEYYNFLVERDELIPQNLKLNELSCSLEQ